MTEWTHTVTGGPWHQRIGRRCRVINPEGQSAYPWHGIGVTEVVVLIENDPFSDRRRWSCVIDRSHITHTNSESEKADNEQRR